MTAIDHNFEPVKIDTSVVVEEERVTLFYIDDREYTIAKTIRPNIVLKYLEDVLNSGAEYALAAAMESVLGEDAMADLAECDQVSQDQMDQIFGLVEKMMMSASKKLSGKSRRGRRN